jgi:hypothetical protein
MAGDEGNGFVDWFMRKYDKISKDGKFKKKVFHFPLVPYLFHF